jgi:hypothetical protein
MTLAELIEKYQLQVRPRRRGRWECGQPLAASCPFPSPTNTFASSLAEAVLTYLYQLANYFEHRAGLHPSWDTPAHRVWCQQVKNDIAGWYNPKEPPWPKS